MGVPLIIGAVKEENILFIKNAANEDFEVFRSAFWEYSRLASK